MFERVPEGNPDGSSEVLDPASGRASRRVYHIGNGDSVELLRYIGLLEKAPGRESGKELLPLLPGDVERSCADTIALELVTGYRPKANIEQGVDPFEAWFRDCYRV